MIETEKGKTEGKKGYTFREGKEIILQGLDRVLNRLKRIDEKLEEQNSLVDSILKTDETPNKPVNK